MTSTSLADEHEALLERAGMVDRSDRGAVLVTGPDAISFLQSLVSADLDALSDGQGAHSLLLTPQGKLDVDFRLLRVGDDCWLDCEPGFGARLAASLERFRLRVKADVSDRSGAWGCLSIRGPDASDRAAPLAARLPDAPHSHTPWGDAVVARSPWGASGGFDVVGPPETVDAAAALLATAGLPSCALAAYEAARIRLGIARQGLDLDDTTIPQEASLERDAVSFTKGCFLGQELVCRIDTRGHVNRFLRRLDARDGGPRPPRGAEVVVGDKVVGTVTSVVAPPELAWAGLGYVRREAPPPAEVTLRWPGGEASAVALELPPPV
jgi:tRNA-modifying protein YgfZ